VEVCFWTIAVILLILWLLGFSFHIGGALIHLVLVIVVIVVVIRLITGRGVVSGLHQYEMKIREATISAISPL
jgi:hypothetical protein